MTAIDGSAAAVTGAASGIGRALALELAARGCDLALADRDEAGLQQVATEIGKTGGRKVTTHRVDVADAKQIQDFAVAANAAPADPDRRRRQVHGPAATVAARDLLVGDGAEAREADDGETGQGMTDYFRVVPGEGRDDDGFPIAPA
jgi:NAD(P)-dependent dehydrogenase (short-subunit alcohol dehydrogenase family)